MLCRHTIHATGRCPINGLPDEYQITVYARRVVLCEEVAAAVDDLLAVPIFQEQFTQALADRLGCRVRTTCRHLEGGRVTTDCICRPRPDAELVAVLKSAVVALDTEAAWLVDVDYTDRGQQRPSIPVGDRPYFDAATETAQAIRELIETFKARQRDTR